MAETMRLLECIRRGWKINENKTACLRKLSGTVFETRHHHHHHVPEGLGVFPVP